MALALPPMKTLPRHLALGANPVALGIGFAVLGFFLFTVMDTAAKALSGGYPIHQIVFFNALFTMVPVTLLVLKTGGVSGLSRDVLPLIALRGASGMIAALAGFFAFSQMPLADVYAVVFAAPLFITALSVPVLGETVGLRRWSAVIVGFVGVIIMLNPGAGLLSLGAVGAIIGALGYATSVLLTRKIGTRASAGTVALFSNLVVLSVMGPWTVIDHVVPSLADLGLFACVGLLGGTGLICIISAFRAMPAAIIAPFQYTQMIWGVAFGYVIWGDIPTIRIAIGCAIVIASGLYIVHRETHLGRPTLRKKGSATIG